MIICFLPENGPTAAAQKTGSVELNIEIKGSGFTVKTVSYFR